MGVDFWGRRVLTNRATGGRKLASGHECPMCQDVASGHPKGRSAAKEPRRGLTRGSVLTPSPTSCGSSHPLFAIYARIYTAANNRQGRRPWASTTARLQSETERSLADEAGGPLAQLIPFPLDPGDDDDSDNPLTSIQAAIGSARGRAMLLETLAGGLGEGKIASPHRDWVANRLGPNPPDAMATIRKDTFAAVLAACGCSPALFDDSDGTSKREALRQWHLGTVRPLAKMLETELSVKLETPIKLAFDGYPLDLVSRSQVVAKLVAAGVTVAEAMATVGLS